MNKKYSMQKITLCSNHFKQQGAAVLTMTLIILGVLTIIGITSSKTSIIEARMTTNSIEKNKSLIAAESGLNKALSDLASFTQSDFLNICLPDNGGVRNGIFDLRTTASDTCAISGGTVPANNLARWNSINSPSSWAWDSATLRETSLDKLSADGSPILTNDTERSNPMKLVSAPQYAIAIHDAVPRMGSEGVSCFPVSIIAAAKGGVSQTQTLIEIKVVPPNGCFSSTP